jgi:ribosome hibernation promoting factor
VSTLGSPPRLGIIHGVKVVISDRTEVVPNRVREHAEQKLDRLGRHFDRVSTAEVEFSQESKRSSLCTCQITVHLDGRRQPLTTARETAARAQDALEGALDKVDRQVLKLKEKIKSRKGSGLNADGFPAEDDPDAAGPLERAVVRVRQMTLEEAEMALDAADRPFLLFREEDTGDLLVCYRRSDGGLTVVEPL